MLLHPLLDCCDVLTTSLISKEVISFADSMATLEEHVSQTLSDIVDGMSNILFCYDHLPEISPSLFTSASLRTLLILPSTTFLCPPFLCYSVWFSFPK